MRKSLAYILLAAGAIVAGSASTLCFAADAAPAEAAAAPTAAPNLSHREMHQMQQTNSEEQRSGDTAEDQATSDDQAKGDAQSENADQSQGDAQAEVQAGGMVQTQAPPAPSQRSMHQQLREATRNQAGGAGGM